MKALQKSDVGKFFVQNTASHQLGWLVDKDDPEKCVTPPFPLAQTAVRLDRPMQVLLKKYDSQWKPIATAHPLSEMAKAKICYAALMELGNAVGDYGATRKDFSLLPEPKRIEFMRKGPIALDPKAEDDVRQELWATMMKVMA